MSLVILLVQVILILTTARIVVWIFRRIHQPAVVGEMIAGIILGPSLFGWVFPGVSAIIFPIDHLENLKLLSEVGLLLFMFVVGMEFEARILREHGRSILIMSGTSIIVPFVLGAMMAFFLYPLLSSDAVPILHFVLFIGLAISITAFPVLARILAESNLLQARVGAVAIACAAVGDITAWLLLAAIVFFVRSDEQSVPLGLMLSGSLLYLGIMWFGVRRGLQQLATMYQRQGEVTQNILTIVLLLVFASAIVTELLGIHALFGAFLVGTIMPRVTDFGHALAEKLESLTVTLLIPLFFAMTGLRTSIGFLNSPQLWFICGLIIVIAVIGKLAGASLVARRSGMTWREAGALGILVNTRGLIEVVFLNIGLEIGVISPTVFTMMVLMALVTTFMTTPLLRWVYSPQLYVR